MKSLYNVCGYGAVTHACATFFGKVWYICIDVAH